MFRIFLEFGGVLDISPIELPYLGGGIDKIQILGQLDQNDMSKFSFGYGLLSSKMGGV